MKVEQRQHDLILKETPWLLWILGVFCLLIGAVFLLIAFTSYAANNDIRSMITAGQLFGGLIGLVVGFSFILRSPISDTTIDRSLQRVTIEKRGIFGRKFQTFGFNEIQGFVSMREYADDAKSVWSVGLALVNGETIKISVQESHFERTVNDIVSQANGYISESGGVTPPAA